MAVSSRTMKVRETTTTANRKRTARETARQEAELANLKRQLAEALERIGQLEQQLAAARKNSSTSSKPLWITEHRALAYWCPHWGKVHYAPLPAAVEKTGLFGPKLTTLVAFMKGVCHASFSTIRKFLRDVVGIKVSRGYLAKPA